jgi:hypothetical protein
MDDVVAAVVDNKCHSSYNFEELLLNLNDYLLFAVAVVV